MCVCVGGGGEGKGGEELCIRPIQHVQIDKATQQKAKVAIFKEK